MYKTLVTAMLLVLCGAARATPQVSGDGACGIRAVDNESFLTCDGDRAPEPADAADAEGPMAFVAPIAVDARQAWKIKRDLGERALLVDIRGRAEVFYTGMPLGADANVPFTEPADGFGIDARTGQPAMQFNARFLERMEDLLRSAHLHHGDPVVLLCRSGERSRLAADLMREHGYLQVFVVRDGFEGPLTATVDGTYLRGERGWKSAGLPWTARVDTRWLYADSPVPAR